jgi:hypothetical protein
MHHALGAALEQARAGLGDELLVDVSDLDHFA